MTFQAILRFLLLLFWMPALLTAEWVKTPGPSGADITWFSQSDDTLFAGVGGGVYRTTNQGNSWTALNTGLTSRADCFAVKGANLSKA